MVRYDLMRTYFLFYSLQEIEKERKSVTDLSLLTTIFALH